ncbi:CAAX prenyl protease-related protein [Telluria aromaticivorans]|uniref:CAAX prenyl protease-related protein n=1 Tax=Telluria aromaticivorans TaxID=2725995 RepID=A0A7Y2P0S2_9BURK|nr:CAAX prenyl protease-related protein [Telluria aromaticivorans]NNG23816.1 CAAX prenyl protease-related protein [Telluria aromaticivorans]
MTEHHDQRTAPAARGPHPAALPAVLRADASADAAAGNPLLSRAAWARILPFGAFIFFIILGDMLERAGVPRDGLRWLYPVQAGSVALLLAFSWRHYHELHVPLPGPAALLAAIGAGVLVFVLWINLDASWMTIGMGEGYNPSTGGDIDWLLVAIRIAGAALVVPLMEELFWRSFLMRWVEASEFEAVEPARVGLKGLLVSSLLFGFEHSLWLAGIVAGLAYAFLYMRYRNLWSAVLAHAVTNGMLGVWVVATGNWTFW